MGNKQTLKGAVIGAGYFSQFQCAAWQQIPEVTITAVSDFSPEKGAAFQQRFGIANFYTDYQEILAQEKPYNLQRHFVDCMVSGKQFENNGQDYLRTILAVEKTYESADLGQVVEIGV